MHRFGLREICPDDFVIGFFKRYHIPQTEGTAGIADERGESRCESVHDPGAPSAPCVATCVLETKSVDRTHHPPPHYWAVRIIDANLCLAVGLALALFH